MARVATSWTPNTAKVAGVAYSSAATTYSSATTSYSSSTSTLGDLGHLSTSWSKPSKIATDWDVNPAAETAQYAYDTAGLYDSTATYDGVVTGQDVNDIKTATIWTVA